MRVKILKTTLPLLLVLLLGGLSLSIASSPAGVGAHGDEYTAEHATKVDEVHGAPASDAHGAVDTHGAEAAHAGDGGGHHKAKSITPEKLKDLFWRTVNFIALMILLIKFLAKPIGNALAGRQQQVVGELESLQEKRDIAERSYKEFESKLAGMEKEMEVVVERAIAQAENEKAKILEDAEQAAEDIKRQAEAAVQAEIVEAKRNLKDEIADQAAAMAEEMIVKNLTPEDQAKITEQYLERVGTV